jgi:hypothetical protein
MHCTVLPNIDIFGKLKSPNFRNMKSLKHIREDDGVLYKKPRLNELQAGTGMGIIRFI